MARIAGTAHFKLNGANYSTGMEEGYTIKIKNRTAKPIGSSDGAIHYAETVEPDVISGSFLTTPDLNPMSVNLMRDVTIQVELANGQTAVLRNAFYTGDGAVDTQKGSFNVEFTGVGIWT